MLAWLRRLFKLLFSCTRDHSGHFACLCILDHMAYRDKKGNVFLWNIEMIVSPKSPAKMNSCHVRHVGLKDFRTLKDNFRSCLMVQGNRMKWWNDVITARALTDAHHTCWWMSVTHPEQTHTFTRALNILMCVCFCMIICILFFQKHTETASCRGAFIYAHLMCTRVSY